MLSHSRLYARASPTIDVGDGGEGVSTQHHDELEPVQRTICDKVVMSTSKVSHDLVTLSRTGVDTSSWHHINASRCTLMGCLLQAGVYKESELFFSDNLNNVDRRQFAVPWLYRNEFVLSPGPGQHYFLENNGITSKADLFVNGQQIATKAVQAGAYGGHTYDITEYVSATNAMLIQVYPTDYNNDFALGFVDWNPYPPDNGTGVWRDVFVKQTGPVFLETLRIITDFGLPIGKSHATVTLKATARNLEDHKITIVAESIISEEADKNPLTKKQTFELEPLQSLDLSITTEVENPALWWPNAWGNQPLYTAQLSVSVDEVTSKVNEYNDTIFSVNGNPLQVMGGGYSADMFLRWDSTKFTAQVQYMLDLGHNTLHLEGKNEHPELYDIADRLGLMAIAGWECCDKWEAWTYNEELAVKVEWSQGDYVTANSSMRHEAAMLQTHPSVLAYLVGSDYWPDDQATAIYVQAFKDLNWQAPIIASAAKRSYPKLLGPSGMKMDGPYDWVPPNYWYDISSTEDRLGAAFGFGSELGAGVGTPEFSSISKFLNAADMNDLWKQPDRRHGAPTSLEDYLLKAQILDYEATRAQFEGFSAYWSAKRPATGLIYWMLNNAWPSLYWNSFDYYLHPAGSYYGTKVGGRVEHVAYDYVQKAVYLINYSLGRQGARTVGIDVIGLDAKVVTSKTVKVRTQPNNSKDIYKLPALNYPIDVIFLRLVLSDEKNATLSRNVYWLAKTIDSLDWENSDWFFTPVTKYADFTALNKLRIANVTTTISRSAEPNVAKLVLENQSSFPAFFVVLDLVDVNKDGQDVVPVIWSDNYVTLWPPEKLRLEVKSDNLDGKAVKVRGQNIAKVEIPLVL
ncbi:glycoside hydrolase family 2 protein [Xylariales sp. AK1849]|nr:glycoside hydrolase family 2 protein [Xylariales sp. AK1849]